jgi:hypothetical protein
MALGTCSPRLRDLLLTKNHSEDVGTGAILQVSRLRGVACPPGQMRNSVVQTVGRPQLWYRAWCSS